MPKENDIELAYRELYVTENVDMRDRGGGSHYSSREYADIYLVSFELPDPFVHKVDTYNYLRHRNNTTEILGEVPHNEFEKVYSEFLRKHETNK